MDTMRKKSESVELGVNQKYFHNILRRSLSQFKLKKPMITDYMIHHLDYLLMNFCYFKDIGLVSEYLCSDNTRFNFAFYRKMNVFVKIIGFGCELNDRLDDEQKINNLIEGLMIDDVRSMIMRSRKDLFGSILDSLDELSSNDDGRMDEIFRNFEIREYFECESEEVLMMNPTPKVLKYFFGILSFHFKLHPHYMIEALDDHSISTLLNLLSFEPALELFGILLDLKGLNMQKLIMLLRDVHPISTLIVTRSYAALKMLLLADWVDGDSDSISSDEEDFFHDEIMSVGTKLVSIFLNETSYIEYKQIYDIIEILNYSHRRPKLELIRFDTTDPKMILYLRLVVGQLDLLMDEIFQRDVHLQFMNLFFNHPDHLALQVPLTIFFSTAIKDPQKLSIILDCGFIDRFQSTCIKSISVDLGPRPGVESIFSCLIYLYPLITFYLSKSNKDLLGTDRWIYLSTLMDPYCKMERLNYSNDESIEAFLGNCIDETFVRYVCHLIIDEMPIPSIFLNKNR